MPDPKTCPQCGAPLPAGALVGLCPACLLKQGATPDSGTQPEAPGFEPPSLEELSRLFPALEILQLLGKGGMGAVYKARQPALDRLVALKILPPQVGSGPGFTDRFTREARALARLNHPNIVAVHEFGQVNGLHYFIMEYVDGTNLRQLEQAGRLSPREALQIVPQICDALQYAHDEGVVHRDIKPENVLIDRKGRVKIADFGLAKILGRDPSTLRLTGEGQVMGTPHYMAPEQVEHPLQVDHRADIYALGVVFYEMLTGELPLGKFAAPSRKVQIDVRLDEVVLHSLEKEPEHRYQKASQVKSDVENIAATPPRIGCAPATAVMPQVSEAQRIQRQVKGPAIGLIVTSILNWILIPMALLIMAWMAASHHSPGVPAGTVKVYFSTALPILIVLLPLLLSSFTIFAAIKMMHLQAYWAAVTASILAILVSPGNIIGLPLGVWALAVLTRKDVRDGFRKGLGNSIPPGTPAGSKSGWNIALLIGGLAMAFLLFLLLLIAASLLFYRFSARKEMSRRSSTVFIDQPQNLVNPVVMETPFSAKLSFGKVELVAVSHNTGKWWRPNGGPGFIEEPDFHIPGAELSALPKMDYHIFVFRVNRPDIQRPDPEWSIDLVRPDPKWIDWPIKRGQTLGTTGEVWWIAAPLQTNVYRTNVRLGLPMPGGGWSDIASANPALTQVKEFRWPSDGNWQVKFNQLKHEGNNLRLTLTRRPDGDSWLVRVIAVDTNGGEHIGAATGASGTTNGKYTWDILFEDLPATDLKEFRVQAQRCDWAAFRNVALYPAPMKVLASVEMWAPAVGAGEKPDPEKVRIEGRELMSKEQYEDALQRFLWYWNHALEYSPSASAVRLSFFLSGWIELARRYPKARQALVEIRDRDTQRILNGGGYFNLFMDVRSINQYLQNEDATYELFTKVEQKDPALARECYYAVESLLVQRHLYTVCLKYLGDPRARFESNRRSWELGKKMDQARVADTRFVDSTCQLIEILAGAGKQSEAENIREQALKLLDDPRLKAAGNQAEQIDGKP